MTDFVLVVDFDGVLNNANTTQTFTHKGRTWMGLDPVNVETLNTICDKVGPATRLLISSNWRNCFSLKKLKKILRHAGFRHTRKILGTTKVTAGSMSLSRRADEISEKLAKLQVTDFIVLDDKDVIAGANVVLVDPSSGLTAQDAETIYSLVAKNFGTAPVPG